MIYIKNEIGKQSIYIPRTEFEKDSYVVNINKTYEDGVIDGEINGIEKQKAKLTTLVASNNGVYEREDGYNRVEVYVTPKTQEKSIKLNKNIEVVVADEGYDSLSKVEIDAVDYVRVVRNEGYNEGYQIGEEYGYKDGYSEGLDEGTTNAEGIIADTAQVLSITENGTYTTKYSDVEDMPLEGNLIKTVNVNVAPKINVEKEGIRLGDCIFSQVPEFYDFDGVTDMTCMFKNCQKLTSIPLIDTSNVTSMNSMCYACFLITTIPLLDTSNVTNMREMFSNCRTLTTIPQIDTSNVTDMGDMFFNCQQLTTIPQIDTSNVTDMSDMFYSCSKLESLPPLNVSKVTNFNTIFGYSDIKTLTDFGGFIGLKTSITNYCFNKLPNLTYESCINILNGLYDFNGNGETPSSSQGKLKVHSNFLTLVGDEISIGTNKGWTITA